MQTEIERIRDMVATLRKGFVNEPADVEGDPVEVTLNMLDEIFRAVERPKSFYERDRWGEFRCRMYGEPTPLERALEIKVQEAAMPLNPKIPLEKRR